MLEKLSHAIATLRRLTHSRGARRAALAVILPFAGGVAAFGISPATAPDEVVVSRVVEHVPLTPAVASSTAEDTYWREERIQRGDTFARLLARLRIEDQAALRFLNNSHEARGFRRLIPGQTVSAHTSGDGRLVELRYATGIMVLTVKPQGGHFRIAQEVAPLERRVVVRSTEIKGGSLFATIDAAHLDDTIADQLADIFSTDVDFHKELREGDRFTVIYEMYFAGGDAVKWGRVLAAELVAAGKPYQAVWFQHESGQGAYYTPDGKPIRKAFLRSPLEYTRISSGFTTARYHPILEVWRAHRGIDYAASIGTGVKATSDGVVDTVGHDRGYGKFVVLRHEQKYTTLYGHLSGFGVGVKRGAHVAQGQVIGYVGATGLATGPHLHYEFRINEVHQDPLRVAMPDAPPITPDLHALFDVASRPMVQRLAQVRGINIARVN